MAFTNIIDIIYPIGSLYESTESTSPAILFGGTWAQIKGACLAAAGENSVAANDYGGNIKIQATQLPQHAHAIRYNITRKEFAELSNEPMKLIEDESNWHQWDALGTQSVILEKSGEAGTIDGAILYSSGDRTTNWINAMYATRLVFGGGKTFCLTTSVAICGIAQPKYKEGGC